MLLRSFINTLNEGYSGWQGRQTGIARRGGGAGGGWVFSIASPAKPALTKKGVLTVFWKLEIIILAYILYLLQGKRSIRLQKSRDLQWALVNIHSNRCHMIKRIVFELSLYQLKISGLELK